MRSKYEYGWIIDHHDKPNLSVPDFKIEGCIVVATFEKSQGVYDIHYRKLTKEEQYIIDGRDKALR